jgi:hypothetical protein
MRRWREWGGAVLCSRDGCAMIASKLAATGTTLHLWQFCNVHLIALDA